MTNKEKFIEVFGLEPNEHFCPLNEEIGCEGCPYSKNGCDEEHKDRFFSMEYKESTTKNNLGVDCISRAEMLRYQQYLHGKMSNEENHKLWEFIKDLPSVTPQEPKTGHWKLVQRDKWIDICCSNCEAVRIKECAYNYTIDQLEEDFKEFLKNGDMKYCPYCGSDNREVKE